MAFLNRLFKKFFGPKYYKETIKLNYGGQIYFYYKKHLDKWWFWHEGDPIFDVSKGIYRTWVCTIKPRLLRGENCFGDIGKVKKFEKISEKEMFLEIL